MGKEIEIRLLTAPQAGKYLSLHPKTLYFLARKGEIQSLRIGKRGVRFDRISLDKWIEQKLATQKVDKLS
ncbi:hypothetical protein BVX98_07620 [bacterium F11]|nr:hypothetical protein BVX98_07620 [bacterium F11]